MRLDQRDHGDELALGIRPRAQMQRGRLEEPAAQCPIALAQLARQAEELGERLGEAREPRRALRTSGDDQAQRDVRARRSGRWWQGRGPALVARAEATRCRRAR